MGNEWTFIVHGIFLGRNFRRVGVDSLFVWNGINHYPAYNGCCRVCCRHMDCSPMASYSQSHGCRIHNGPSWCQDAEDIYLYFLAVSVFTTGSFLYPVAKIVEVTTGIPLTTAIFALGAFSMVYVALGGLRGVVVTDVLQFVILLRQ